MQPTVNIEVVAHANGAIFASAPLALMKQMVIRFVI